MKNEERNTYCYKVLKTFPDKKDKILQRVKTKTLSENSSLRQKFSKSFQECMTLIEGNFKDANFWAAKVQLSVLSHRKLDELTKWLECLRKLTVRHRSFRYLVKCFSIWKPINSDANPVTESFTASKQWVNQRQFWILGTGQAKKTPDVLKNFKVCAKIFTGTSQFSLITFREEKEEVSLFINSKKN